MLRSVMVTERPIKRTANPRADYIAIASRLFAAKGFNGVSLAMVAGQAGVTKQALLHFFGTKEQLYREVLSALAERLMDEIESSYSPDPARHLTDYFSYFVQIDNVRINDAQLVIHALLDSDAEARQWPLKPYLESLIKMVRAVPGGAKMTEEKALAWGYHIIGAVQYLAVSAPTIDGMLGISVRETLEAQTRQFVEHAVSELIGPDLKPNALQ